MLQTCAKKQLYDLYNLRAIRTDGFPPPFFLPHASKRTYERGCQMTGVLLYQPSSCSLSRIRKLGCDESFQQRV